MVAEFIRKRGVTQCPGMGTKELAEFNAQRDREYRESGRYHWRAIHRRRKRRIA